jgi:putative PIN family toxin of toxin-antitoxin system
MIDSNIVVSALVYGSSGMGRVIESICADHELCVATCCMEEVRGLMASKFTGAEGRLDEFFGSLPLTLVQTPDELGAPLFDIRDPKDYAVLHTAVVGQVDVFVTGDKDFFGVKVDRPEIMHPLDYLRLHGGGRP